MHFFCRQAWLSIGLYINIYTIKTIKWDVNIFFHIQYSKKNYKKKKGKIIEVYRCQIPEAALIVFCRKVLHHVYLYENYTYTKGRCSNWESQNLRMRNWAGVDSVNWWVDIMNRLSIHLRKPDWSVLCSFFRVDSSTHYSLWRSRE